MESVQSAWMEIHPEITDPERQRTWSTAPLVTKLSKQ